MRAYFLSLLLLCAAALSLSAQTDSLAVDTAGVTATPPDTTQQDSNSWFRRHIPAPLLPQSRPPFNPAIAWKRALILPGWGQMYNRDYWKLPIVYGALGTFVFQVWSNNSYYQQYRTLYRSIIDTTVVAPNPIRLFMWQEGTPTQGIPELAARNTRNQYRTNRDRMIIFGTLCYGLIAIEAYVDAHLKAFDVSEDLSMRLSPTLMPSANTVGPGFKLAWRF